MYRQNMVMNMNPPIHPVTALHMRRGVPNSEMSITVIPVVVMPLAASNRLWSTANPRSMYGMAHKTIETT